MSRCFADTRDNAPHQCEERSSVSRRFELRFLRHRRTERAMLTTELRVLEALSTEHVRNENQGGDRE
jgi:hypothetical protein